MLSWGAFDRVEIGITEQRQFAANASHELRTPLTVIATNLEVKLLILSRAGAAGLRHQREDLRNLAVSAIERADHIAAEHEIDLVMNAGETSMPMWTRMPSRSSSTTCCATRSDTHLHTRLSPSRLLPHQRRESASPTAGRESPPTFASESSRRSCADLTPQRIVRQARGSGLAS